MELRFYIKRPVGKRRSFALVCYQNINGSRVYRELSPNLASSVDSIQASYRALAITNVQAEALLRDLIERTQAAANVSGLVTTNAGISAVNSQTFERFWHDEYGTRFLRDESAARCRLLKALRLIEPLQIHTASAHDLLSRLRHSAKNVSELRYAVDRLNQILRYLRRNIKLNKPRPEYRTVRHLTQAELNAVLAKITNKGSCALAATLFASGCRLSEALGLAPCDLNNGSLNVNKQLTRSGVRPPKRGKSGRTVLIPGYDDLVRAWLSLEPKELYRELFTKHLQRACKALFPDEVTKRISPHDLRHSYAIHCLAAGVSLDEISLSLRNTVPVCQRYYVGFAHTPGTLSRMSELLRVHESEALGEGAPKEKSGR